MIDHSLFSRFNVLGQSMPRVVLLFSLIISFTFADSTAVTEVDTLPLVDSVQIDSTISSADTLPSFSETPVDDSSSAESEKDERDSSTIAEMRLGFLAQLREQSKYLYTHPVTADTLFNAYDINRMNFSRDDYYTWSDVLRSHGEFTPIYYSPRHQQNRALWRGYTLPLTSQQSGLLAGAATSEKIFPNYEPIQVETMKLNASGQFSPTLYPHSRISPQVFFLMETGLFDGNSLDLRLMRNLTRNLSLGLFTSFRTMQKVDYRQSVGGMAALYKGFKAVDTAMQVNTGRNPLSENQTTTIDLKWQKRSSFEILYRYQDLSNDVIFEHDSMPEDSDYDSIWYNRNAYISDLRLISKVPVAEQFRLDLEGEVHKNVQVQNPLSSQLVFSTDVRRGEQAYQGFGGALHYTPFANDTVRMIAAINRSVTEHTNDDVTTVHETNLLAENQFYSANEMINIKANAGVTLFQANGELEKYPVTEIVARVTPEKYALEGWGRIATVPLVVGFDSTQIPEAGRVGDQYWGAGMRASVTGKRLSLTTGYSYITAVRESSVAAYWQNQMAPYSNPGNVFSFTPSFGEWKGISVSSSWKISDTKPHFKSTSRINFHVNKKGETRHFYTSFYLNYWSKRDDLGYAGRENWNQPIHDLGMKLTAEIKSFRIFYKMDNIFNRRNSYVPGYYMPGTVIRWGFAWSITG